MWQCLVMIGQATSDIRWQKIRIKKKTSAEKHKRQKRPTMAGVGD